ncbi:MAG: tetratricopeptide repeat protein [Acidobacteria bacterium]|nr:tetratricopeptide repeat protein [Acidobacteriota bacterium]
MFYRTLVLVAVGLFSVASTRAQSPSPSPAPVRSHVERFSTIETRAERVEADAGAKLAANPNDAVALNSRGVARLFLGRYQEAQDDLRRAVALKSDNSAYQANFGSALWKLGRVEEAVNAERAALKLDDKNFTAHYQLGRFLMRLGGKERQTEAAAHLRRALELDPRQYDVRFELVAVYRELGDRAQASNQLDFLWDARPSDPRVFYTSALLATDRDDLDAAIKDLQEALRRDPTFFSAWQDLGVAYMKLRRWNEAVVTFNELSRLRPDAVDAAYLQALSLFNAGRVEEAEREARRALRLNAGAVEAHTLLGVILASRGNANAEAIEALSQAAALNPKLGRAYALAGRYAEAADALKTATTLAPSRADGHYQLGLALRRLGRDAEAAREFAVVDKLNTEFRTGAAARQ